MDNINVVIKTSVRELSGQGKWKESGSFYSV